MLASMLMTSLTIIVLLVVTFDDGDGGWRARWWWETRLQRSSRSPDTEGHSWHDNDTMSFAMAIFGVTSTDSKTDTQAASAFTQGAVIMVHDVECMVCVTGMLRFGDLLSNKGKYEAAKEKCAKEGGSRRLHENGVCPILSIRVP